MSTDPEHDDLAQDLHAMREEPRPEFARELDRRAAGWLRERPTRRLPSLRIAIPAMAAAAAAAVVVAIVVAGGEDGGGGADRLEVAVVSEGSPQSGFGASPGGGAAAPEDSLAPSLERDAPQPQPTGGAFLLPSTEDGTVTVRYLFPAPADATVELAGREAEVTLEPGSGSLEISTEGLPQGAHDLTITTPSAPTFRERIQIGG
jgi:hypothetical protein